MDEPDYELAPCPFCGGEDIWLYSAVAADGSYDSAQCTTCGASTGVYNNEDEAIVAWNTRYRG